MGISINILDATGSRTSNFEVSTPYDERVRSKLLGVGQEGSKIRFEDLAKAGDGLFPTDILHTARALGLKIELANEGYSGPEVTPHPSPAMSEWFFTTQTADFLARLLPGKTLCLGAPTVAKARSRKSAEVTLVDKSEWLEERFDLAGSKVDFLPGASLESLSLDVGYDSVILDPPWYFPTFDYWIHLASSVLNVGGMLLIPLLGTLTRPSATEDRERILSAVSAMGPWTIQKNCVIYDTPRFERLALERAGIFLKGPWRRSDLLLVRNDFPAMRPAVPKSQAGDWKEFRYRDSLVAVRGLHSDWPYEYNSDFRVSGLGSEDSFLLDSVSRRDPRIQEANVWTSENTVAQCSDVFSLKRLFERSAETMNRAEESLFKSIVTKLELPT